MASCSIASLAKEVGEHQLDEVDKKILALRKFPNQASSDGPEKTRNVLLPAKTASMESENERLVREYVKLLSQMVEEVGGSEYIYCLMDQLKSLINMQFMTISSDDRDQIAHSIISLTEMMSASDQDKLFFPLIEELCKDNFLKKCLCCSLLPTAYEYSKDKPKIYRIFLELCNDSADVVVQAASSILQDMIHSVETVETDLQEVVKKLAVDASMPPTRVNAIEALVDLFGKVNPDAKEQLIQNVLRVVIHDKSEEVRVLIASKIPSIQSKVGYPIMKGLVKFVTGQIEKGGTRVRVKAIENLKDFIGGFPASDIPDIVGRFHILKDLTVIGEKPEKTEAVRIALATTVTRLASIVPLDIYNEAYVPLIEELMSDECPKIREALVTNIGPVVQLIGQDRFVNTFTELVTEMAAHDNWRVRNSVLNAMNIMRFPPETVANLMCSLLKDKCFELRSSAASQLRNIVQKYEDESWLVEKMISLSLELSKDEQRFWLRITSVKAFESMCSSFSKEKMNECVYPCLERLTKDITPYVRINVVRCYASILLGESLHLDETRRFAIIDQLKAFTKDPDFDVKRTASRSLDYYNGSKQDTMADASTMLTESLIE